jgi:predicted Zn-dependent protease
LERLGLLYRQNDQPTEAIAAFRQMAETDPETGSRAAAQIIETYRGARDYKKAVEEADAAKAKYPNDRMIKLVRANLLAENGRTDEAVKDVRTLLDGKSDREVYLSLAQIYEKARNYQAMAKAIDDAEKLSGNEEKENLTFMRGAMFEKMKDFDAAEREFRKVLSADPQNASALNYLGYMLADRNIRLTEALDMIKKAVDQEPTNGAFLDSLGWVLYRLDRADEAESTLVKAAERAPRDPTVHDHLGDVYFKQGKLKDAISQWDRSLVEWKASAPSEADPSEVAKLQKKVDSARVRLAKESGSAAK